LKIEKVNATRYLKEKKKVLHLLDPNRCCIKLFQREIR